MRKLIYILILIPFFASGQSLYTKDFSKYRVLQGEAVINGEKVKPSSSDSTSLLRFNGNIWSDWLPEWYLLDLADVKSDSLTESGQFPVWNQDSLFFDFDYSAKMAAIKVHRIDTVKFGEVGWTDIKFDTIISSESVGDMSLNDDSITVTISNFTDIFGVAGCVHTNWTGAAGTSVIIATRILISEDEGANWHEARCLQTLEKQDRGANAEGTNLYNGTVVVDGSIWLKLQVYVSNTAMILEGDPIFDNPVAATLHISNIGNNKPQ